MDLQLNLRLKKFDQKDGKAPLVVVFGKIGTGKTHLIHDLVYHQGSIPVGNVFCSKHEKSFYEKFVPNECIHDEYNSDIVENFMLQRDGVVFQKKEEEEEHDDRSFFILDNCFYDNKWIGDDKVMQKMFKEGKYLKILTILSLSYPMGVSPALRGHIDYVFVFRDTYKSNRLQIWNNYASSFSTFESFCSVMDQTTDNYECLVISLCARTNKIEDNLFWYKAD